jgi:hypothetical protein
MPAQAVSAMCYGPVQVMGLDVSGFVQRGREGGACVCCTANRRVATAPSSCTVWHVLCAGALPEPERCDDEGCPGARSYISP